jgi:hypothetical protein
MVEIWDAGSSNHVTVVAFTSLARICSWFLKAESCIMHMRDQQARQSSFAVAMHMDFHELK